MPRRSHCTCLGGILLLVLASLLPAQSFQPIDVLGLDGLYFPGIGVSGGRPTAQVYQASIPWQSLGAMVEDMTLVTSGQNTLRASRFSAEASARASWLLGGASAQVMSAHSNVTTSSENRLVLRFFREASSTQWIPCMPATSGSGNPVYSTRFEELRNLGDPLNPGPTQAATQIADDYGDAVATHVKGLKMFEIMIVCETRTVDERNAAENCLRAEFGSFFNGISSGVCTQNNNGIDTTSFLLEMHRSVLVGDGSPLPPTVPVVMSLADIAAWLPTFSTDLDTWWNASTPAISQLGLQSINTQLPAAISVSPNPVSAQLRTIFDALVAQHLDNYLEVEEFKTRVLALVNVGPFFNPPMPTWLASALTLYAGSLQVYLDTVRQVAFDILHADDQAGLQTVMSAVSALQAPPLFRSIFSEIERGAEGDPTAYVLAAESGLLDWRARVNARWLRRKFPSPQDPGTALRQAASLTIQPVQDGTVSISPVDLIWLPRDGVTTVVEVVDTDLTNVEGLGNLPNLQILRLIRNDNLTNFNGVAAARQLTDLHLEENGPGHPIPLGFLGTNWRLRSLYLKGQPIQATALSNLVGTYFLQRLEFAEPDGHDGIASRHFFLDVICELENVAMLHRTYASSQYGADQYLGIIPSEEHAAFTAAYANVYSQTFGNHYHNGWGSWTISADCELEFESVYWPSGQYERTVVDTNFQEQVLPQPVYSALPPSPGSLSPEFLNALGNAALWGP